MATSMLTARQVAHLLNVHINTVRRWSNKGVLNAYRIGPRGDRRFKREEVALLLVEGTDGLARNRREENSRISFPGVLARD
jgi:excisionase family DNA binding protein